jgi:hypothetical protein
VIGVIVMAIPDRDRSRYEAIGLTAIRRELEVGNVQYLHGEVQRRQAREWVVEEVAKAEKETKRARKIEAVRFYAGLLVGIIAAIGAVIAAWPVIKEWIR